MLRFAQGNLLAADVEAVVNTVNTVGVMGKGIALMFKEQFPDNFKAYAQACKQKDVRIGRMFVTEREDLYGPRWVVNFPTKTSWRVKTRKEWVAEGLQDLVRVIKEHKIGSIAVPPLGCGNGGLNWLDIRPLIVEALEPVDGLRAIIYEPTEKYSNVVKRLGVEKLTPARALIAEMVRRYEVLGMDCSILEVQKLAWFVERGAKRFELAPFGFAHQPDRYGPYSDKLRHMLDALDGSYLHCDKRLADASPLDLIWFDRGRKDKVSAYLKSGEGKGYRQALDWASDVIDGFQSPHGMELLATVDWLLEEEQAEPSVSGIRDKLRHWSGGPGAAERKLRIFDERVIGIALEQLNRCNKQLV